MATEDTRQQLRADADWHRAEVARLAVELNAMTPGRAAALGPNAVRRMHTDHDVHLQLAEELEAYLATFALVAGEEDQAGLF